MRKETDKGRRYSYAAGENLKKDGNTGKSDRKDNDIWTI